MTDFEEHDCEKHGHVWAQEVDCDCCPDYCIECGYESE